MNGKRNYVMTVAGFDPSGGAGLLADVKTFEKHKAYGLAVNTGNTIQTEDKFHSMQWEKMERILETIAVLMDNYEIKAMKTGIVPSWKTLDEIVSFIKSKNENVKIVVDPVIRASSGFDFQSDLQSDQIIHVLKRIDLLTPNTNEAIALGEDANAIVAAKKLAQHCAVLLKGGHAFENPGTDILMMNGKEITLHPNEKQVHAKHGSGCILSAAITANLGLGHDLEESCRLAKRYTENALMSNTTLLAYHHV